MVGSGHEILMGKQIACLVKVWETSENLVKSVTEKLLCRLCIITRLCQVLM